MMHFSKTAMVEKNRLVFEVTHDHGSFIVIINRTCLQRYFGCGKEVKADFYKDNCDKIKHSIRRAFEIKDKAYIKANQPTPDIDADLILLLTIEKWGSFINEDGRLTETGVVTATFNVHDHLNVIEVAQLVDRSKTANFVA
jgi:hypothetical protein